MNSPQHLSTWIARAEQGTSAWLGCPHLLLVVEHDDALGPCLTSHFSFLLQCLCKIIKVNQPKENDQASLQTTIGKKHGVKQSHRLVTE
jgi:hypothetical protein